MLSARPVHASSIPDCKILYIGMEGELGKRTRRYPEDPSISVNNSSSSNDNNDNAASFECNICFELAQDPIVTLCGHLFCWPCLYKWLHVHSHSQECPVCKALVEEDKLVPLYGRGKTTDDPRSRSIPDIQIPNRPTGQRPSSAPPPAPNHFAHQHPWQMVGPPRFGNYTFSAAIGGLFPNLNFQVHGFPDATTYGGFPYGNGIGTFHGGHGHAFHHHHHHRPSHGQQAEAFLKALLFLVATLVLATLILA